MFILIVPTQKNFWGWDFVLALLFFFLQPFRRFFKLGFLALVIHHWKALEKLFHLYQGQLLRIICLEDMKVWSFLEFTILTGIQQSTLAHRGEFFIIAGSKRSRNSRTIWRTFQQQEFKSINMFLSSLWPLYISDSDFTFWKQKEKNDQ